jgi:hypothetical protein
VHACEWKAPNPTGLSLNQHTDKYIYQASTLRLGHPFEGYRHTSHFDAMAKSARDADYADMANKDHWSQNVAQYQNVGPKTTIQAVSRLADIVGCPRSSKAAKEELSGILTGQ